MSHFRKKINIDEFLEKRKQAENEIMINLSEEIRHLNKWISDYEELEKFRTSEQSELIKTAQFPY